jgi:DNA-binding MarR family transcriptional regulator
MQEKITKLNIDEELKLDNQLCFPMYAASRIVVQAYGPMMAELEITYPQFLVLLVLWELDGQSVNEIGSKLYLDSGTLTPLLQKMVKSGLILRKRCREDQREVNNFLTAKAKAMKVKAAKLRNELFCTSGLGQDESDRIRDHVKMLVKRLLS